MSIFKSKKKNDTEESNKKKETNNTITLDAVNSSIQKCNEQKERMNEIWMIVSEIATNWDIGHEISRRKPRNTKDYFEYMHNGERLYLRELYYDDKKKKYLRKRRK